jgi:hypothetical protein
MYNQKPAWEDIMQQSNALIEKIKAWDFSQIKDRLVHTEGMDPDTVDAMEEGYRQYLTLLALQSPGTKTVVSKQVDDFGHQHILFTEDMERFRAEIFPLNHRPTITQADREELRPQYENETLPALREIFGDEIDPNIWDQRCVCFWDNDRICAEV